MYGVDRTIYSTSTEDLQSAGVESVAERLRRSSIIYHTSQYKHCVDVDSLTNNVYFVMNRVVMQRTYSKNCTPVVA